MRAVLAAFGGVIYLLTDQSARRSEKLINQLRRYEAEDAETWLAREAPVSIAELRAQVDEGRRDMATVEQKLRRREKELCSLARTLARSPAPGAPAVGQGRSASR
jgi:hypothetical protein